MEPNWVQFVDYSSTMRQQDRWLIDTLTIHQSALNTQRPPWKSMDKQERPGNRVMKRRNSSARNRSRPAGARFSSPLVLIWIHFFPSLIGHGWEPTRRGAARREPRKSSFDEEEIPSSSFLRSRNRGTASPNLHFSKVTSSAVFLQRKVMRFLHEQNEVVKWAVRNGLILRIECVFREIFFGCGISSDAI